jgi:hypothetical protein
MSSRCAHKCLLYGAGAIVLLIIVSPAWAVRTFDARTIDLAAVPGVSLGSNDWFGYSVAVDGGIAVVGVPKSDIHGTNSGKAYVFERTGGGAWVRTQTLWVEEPNDYEQFGYAVDVDASEALIVIGAPYEDSSADTNRGAVYVFKIGSTMWPLASDKLVASIPDDGDHFGKAVAVDGETIVVGAPDEDRALLSTDQGSAYVFKPDTDHPDPDQWEEVKVLTSNDREPNARFGYSVAVDGDTIMVGEPYQNCESDANRGAVHFFRVSDLNEAGHECAPDPDGSSNDHFGWSVAVDGGYAAIGSPGDTGTMGSSYIYEVDGSDWGWKEMDRVYSHTPCGSFQILEDQHFGHAVAVFDAADGRFDVTEAIVVGGAPDENEPNTTGLPADVGGVRLYGLGPINGWEPHVDLWEPVSTGSDHDANDHFGYSVATSALTSSRAVIVIGAPQAGPICSRCTKRPIGIPTTSQPSSITASTITTRIRPMPITTAFAEKGAAMRATTVRTIATPDRRTPTAIREATHAMHASINRAPGLHLAAVTAGMSTRTGTTSNATPTSATARTAMTMIHTSIPSRSGIAIGITMDTRTERSIQHPATGHSATGSDRSCRPMRTPRTATAMTTIVPSDPGGPGTSMPTAGGAVPAAIRWLQNGPGAVLEPGRLR